MGVQEYLDEGYYYTCWLTDFWSTQVKVEGMLKAAWHWDCDCSVVNDPLGEPGCTPLYARLPPAWGSVDHEQMFSVFPFLGIRKEGSGDGHLSPWGAPLVNLEGDSSTGDLRRLWRWAPFSTGALLRIMGGQLTRNS